MLSANQQGMTITGSLPLCTSSLTREPATDRDGKVIAYEKPLMLLVDEFTTSAADSVASVLDDSGRAVLYGMRTNGAGGNNISLDTGSYSEGSTGMTLALQTRGNGVVRDGYPYTNLIENVGVWPQVRDDYMTKTNLLQNGAPFVSGFRFRRLRFFGS